MPERLIRPLVRVVGDLLRSSARVVPVYSRRYPRVVLRAARDFVDHGFGGTEALQLGILDPGFCEADLRLLVSKRRMARIQNSLNPLPFQGLTENKAVFYMYCQMSHIPVPALYALFFHNMDGFLPDGRFLDSPEAWQSFIANELPSEFIVKRALGVYGQGLFCFCRTGQGDFTEVASGRRYDAPGIHRMMAETNQDHVVQQRVFNHDSLGILSGGDGLQTLRLYTYVDKQGRVRMLSGLLKVIVGRGISDNIAGGKSGNLIAGINLENGTLEETAVRPTPNASGTESFSVHPDTGVAFGGFAIPLWSDACQLAEEAARKLMPIRLIGWDIAVAPQGPLIIEANVFADPVNILGTPSILVAAVRHDGKDVAWAPGTTLGQRSWGLLRRSIAERHRSRH